MKELKSMLLYPVLLTGLFLLFLTAGAMAQPSNGGPKPTGPVEDPVGIPIDGGASLLLAAGAAYGIKKVNDYRKSSKQQPEA